MARRIEIVTSDPHRARAADGFRASGHHLIGESTAAHDGAQVAAVAAARSQVEGRLKAKVEELRLLGQLEGAEPEVVVGDPRWGDAAPGGDAHVTIQGHVAY